MLPSYMNPYMAWYSTTLLQQEATRLRDLPEPAMNASIVMRWRRQRLIKIDQRVKEITWANKQEMAKEIAS